MCNESLKINEKLGRQQGIATVYINLGILAIDQGEFKNAKKMFINALDIAKKIGFKQIEGQAENLLKKLG
jgi:Tfp pilus assembly protein PilF